MNFFQQYETSSVMKIDLCANKNQDQRSEAQTLQNFLCNLELSKIGHRGPPLHSISTVVAPGKKLEN